MAFHKGKVILLHQFRHAIRSYEYALVRGFGEAGISAQENVCKELHEEIAATGITSVERLGTIKTDTGLTNKEVEIYTCQVDDYNVQKHEEGIDKVCELTIEEFEQWLRDGRIKDDFTIQAYALWRVKMNHGDGGFGRSC